ncbi:Tyrosine-protein kinase receptor Tie-2 [Holothuria leucospilota]|uniref:Tyrosine-protein kinase receptor Tie-2 n=1 Tax=Holothuria leucospilota TaxID=206669 RepID=A0A9Q1CU39_HOLLE|nr:Tyrosine-protein kinase receptor Tie-2 [Holothuria leucospilota]
MLLLIFVFWYFTDTTEGYQEPTHGFYVVTNQPFRGRNSEDIYLYAINTAAITSGEEIEFSKEGGLQRDIIETGEIEAMGTVWGCYLRVGPPNRFKGSRFGTYEATYTPIDGSPTITRNTFVRPNTSRFFPRLIRNLHLNSISFVTEFLNTRGVYTVTVYPSAPGSTDLAKSDDNPIGVSWTPGCLNIRWCKDRRRNVNTGPRLTLTSTKDAGIYTIQRQQRGKRGWFVQIEVIVATCPMNQYWDGMACVTRSNYPCVNGGVPRNAADVCSCPPYFGGSTCGFHYLYWVLILITEVDISDEIFALGYAFTAKLFCSDLVGGHNQCRGLLFCLGDLFGCKCFPGWHGNNCDRGKNNTSQYSPFWSDQTRC